jgi:WD40 repeat protein
MTDLPVTAAGFSPDGGVLAVGLHDGSILLWQYAEDKRQVLEAHQDTVQGVVWSRDGSLFASFAGDSIRVWDDAGQPVATNTDFAPLENGSVAWSPDRSSVALAVPSMGLVAIIDPLSGEVIKTIDCPLSESGVNVLLWSPDGSLIAVQGGVIDPVRGTQVESLESLWIVMPWAFAWSPDSSQLATGDAIGLITMWDINRGD